MDYKLHFQPVSSFPSLENEQRGSESSVVGKSTPGRSPLPARRDLTQERALDPDCEEQVEQVQVRKGFVKVKVAASVSVV